VYIAPTDAANRGIQDGDMVKVYNDSGTVVVQAVIAPWLIPGVIHLPEGRWGNFINGVDRRGNANTLTYVKSGGKSCSFPQMTIAEVARF